MIANPWLALAAVVALSGAYAYGRYDGRQLELATQYRESRAAEVSRDAALKGAAEAISKIEVRNVTIRQQAETITREVPVYRECRHDPRGMRMVNEALAGAEPTDPRELP